MTLERLIDLRIFRGVVKNHQPGHDDTTVDPDPPSDADLLQLLVVRRELDLHLRSWFMATYNHHPSVHFASFKRAKPPRTWGGIHHDDPLRTGQTHP